MPTLARFRLIDEIEKQHYLIRKYIAFAQSVSSIDVTSKPKSYSLTKCSEYNRRRSVALFNDLNYSWIDIDSIHSHTV